MLLKSIPGVVDHGLFIDICGIILMGTDDGVTDLPQGMTGFDYDLFVIGAGSGGVRAAPHRGAPWRQAWRWPRNTASAAPA